MSQSWEKLVTENGRTNEHRLIYRTSEVGPKSDTFMDLPGYDMNNFNKLVFFTTLWCVLFITITIIYYYYKFGKMFVKNCKLRSAILNTKRLFTFSPAMPL